MRRRALPFLLVVWVLLQAAQGFYIPGVPSHSYEKGDPLFLKVNKLVSAKTQLPYAYYDLPFCRPPVVIDAAENLGEILSGDRIENSPYEIHALLDVPCKVLCRRETSTAELALFAERIEENYRVNWILDNLPGANKVINAEDEDHILTFYEPDFPLGSVQEVSAAAPDKEDSASQHKMAAPHRHLLNNHAHLRIMYHSEPDAYTGVRVVGFEVEARSIDHGPFDYKDAKAFPPTCLAENLHGPFEVRAGMEATAVTWTYSVEWVKSDTKWASRWDIYLLMTQGQNSVHWFSIINSLMIVIFLTGMIAMIMMRSVNSDFRRYREIEDLDDPQEETGWKLVHGDVFRPPKFPLRFSVLVGSGVQVFSMTVVTLVFAVLGFLSPANRGGLLTALVVLFLLMGLLAGYSGARVYKMLGGLDWRRFTTWIASALPLTVFSIFFVLNLCLYGEHSAGYVPLLTLFGLVALWFGISVPLVFLGSYFGFRKPVPEQPVRTNQIPRQVPLQVWYMQPIFCILTGGILPFGAIFIELFFILSSIWQHQFYYIFGFLTLVFLILILTCAEITIVLCYFQLCSEDYRWWWRSFLTSSSAAIYAFIYGVYYFFTKLDITKPVSILLYFGYTFIMSLGLALLTGTIGFIACYFFIRKIYSAIKVN